MLFAGLQAAATSTSLRLSFLPVTEVFVSTVESGDSYSSGEANSGFLFPLPYFELRMDAVPGTYTYYCDTCPGMVELIGEAETGDEAVRLTVAMQPDVVLMDIQMPGINGIEAARLGQSKIEKGDNAGQGKRKRRA